MTPDPRTIFSKNLPLLNIFAALKMALLPMAIITLFWKDQIGLSLTEILILQAIFSVATLLMEFPSGYLSDRLGYRFALNLACIFGITGWATYTLASSFLGVLIAEIQLGISYAFISGADSALLYETLRQEDREEDYAKHDGRMTAWAQVGEAVGALGAGVFYAWMPLLPFFLQIGVWITALFVCRNLKEVPAPEKHVSSHLRESFSIARKAFIDQPGLRYAIILAALFGLTSFFPVWLIQPYMQSLNVPLSWFGPIWAIANLCVSLGSVISHRIQYHMGPKLLPFLLFAMVALGYAGLAFSHVLWSFAFYFLLTLMRGIHGPFSRLVMQKQSERHERASILSLKSLTFRLSFVITAPLIGMLADQSGLHTTFTFLMIVQCLLIAIFLRPFLKHTEKIWVS